VVDKETEKKEKKETGKEQEAKEFDVEIG